LSDVVAVGLITAGSSLIAAAIGAVATYKVSSRNAAAAIATAESQNRVELARIEAENTRLTLQYEEDERRNRQATYHQTLSTLQSIYALDGTHDDNFSKVAADWRYCRAGINIFGSESTSVAIDEAHKVVEKFPDNRDEGDKNEAWESDLGRVTHNFISAVRMDLGVDAAAEAQGRD
jgi:hypothetical protein